MLAVVTFHFLVEEGKEKHDWDFLFLVEGGRNSQSGRNRFVPRLAAIDSSSPMADLAFWSTYPSQSVAAPLVHLASSNFSSLCLVSFQIIHI